MGVWGYRKGKGQDPYPKIPGKWHSKCKGAKIMSTEFAPVAVAKWEQELIDSAKASRTLTVAKIQCAWCCDQAKWKITDQWSTEYACTAHGAEWWPELFPVEFTSTCLTCKTVKIIEGPWNETFAYCADCAARVSPVGVKATFKYPWYPLMAHRDGLRRNDPGTLASALFIVSLEGGTAHHGSCNGVAGEGCGICEGRR